MAKSKAIFSRKKAGKTALIQRLFKKSNKSLVRHVRSILEDESKGRFDSMWLKVCSAPRTFASVFDIRFLVMIDEFHAKRILLHMSSDPKRIWIPKELKDELHLEISEQDILERLRKLEKADLIQGGDADIEFMGVNDGTLHLILRSRYGREIQDFEPDIRVDFEKRLDELENKIKSLKKDKKSLSGQLNVIKGEVAEDRLAKLLRKEKRFSLSKFFQGVKDTSKLNIIDVRTHILFQRADGKNMEVDIKAESDCGRVVIIEVKKWKKKISINVVQDFFEKIEIYSKENPNKKILPAIKLTGCIKGCGLL